MSRIDRYLLSQLMTMFGFFALVLVAVYWVNRAVSLFDQLISDGQSAWVFLEFTALTLPNVIRLVLPVAGFAAAVHVTNRLAAESELVVMQATGVSPLRMARPVVVFGLVVGLMVAVLAHVLVPASRARLAERSAEIAENVTARFLREGAFLHPADGVTLYVRTVSGGGELRDIFLSDSRERDRETTYTAERAMLVRGDSGPKLVMFDGMAQVLSRTSRQIATTRFDDFAYDIGALIDPGAVRGRDVDQLSTAALLRADPADIAGFGTSRAEMVYLGHDRLAQPGLALAAALIGFAALLIGGFSRFGRWPQIGAAVAALIGLHLVTNLATRVALRDAGLWPVVHLPVLAGLALAALLLALAARRRRVPAGTGGFGADGRPGVVSA
ncbi:MAG: LPS export ABC transporter permease LptF [Alphaproteobacteria bacterium HGW-Alphaproteobacteria-6]|nr:MAG: LPS export ABC transporter permease LptF [Alphaproteobacteria bacterium HGW-Alphaproteobacteria-6]